MPTSMPPPMPPLSRLQLATQAREQFVSEAEKALTDLGGMVQDRLTQLLNERGTTRDMQARRDTWMLYQKQRTLWIDGTLKLWREALRDPTGKMGQPAASRGAELALDDASGLSLQATDAVENKILASRLVLSVAEKLGSELDDLRIRVKALENREELGSHDVLRPEVLILLLIEQWATAGMPRDSWAMVSDVAQKHLSERLKTAYSRANQFLVQRGVMPTIDLKDRVRRTSAPRRAPEQAAGADGDPVSSRTAPFQDPGEPSQVPSGWVPGASHPGALAQPPGPARSLFGGRLGWDDAAGSSPSQRAPFAGSPGMPAGPTAQGGQGHQAQGYAGGQSTHSTQGRPLGQTPSQMHQSMLGASAPGAIHEETRLLTHTTPLMRSRSRAQGMFGQLKRMLMGQGVPDFGTQVMAAPSPGLAAALAQPTAYVTGAPVSGGSGTVYEDYSPAAVAQVAHRLRERTDELKQKAETKSEKAVIEMVALMFQAILAEDRIPSAIRVWFARLQMPVLRLALSDSDFFGSINHPARQLIDRMGSCVLGFDNSGISDAALETEIKRIVQVIEQYPETGKRVFQIVYDEFQKFLGKYLTGKEATQKVVSVAQQVEQKETLTIQYTIELRNLLKDIPVRDEIRTFLFKVWAEVLSVSAVRKGPKDPETVALKKAAADLVWSASAKPNRADRARVIQDLPQLLQRLRAGMSLLGLSQGDQDAHIKIVSDTMADAFMSKTQAIPPAQIEALTQRLANLEDFVSEEGVGDLPLDAESIEMMLGIDASRIVVVANGGSKPTPAMVSWAQELQTGAWFTLDHNGKVTPVQFAWRSDRKHLNLFASADGRSYLIQAGRLAAYLQAGLLLPQEEETLTVRATREALAKIEANPERLVR